MQDVMKWVLTCQEPPSLNDVVAYGAQMGLHDIADDKKKIYRALKKLTDGIAKQVVVSTKDEDGYTAWHRLAGQFEPSLIAMRGEALSELNGMSKVPAKNPQDTKRLLNVFQNRRKIGEDVTGIGMDGLHLMSTILGFMDP